MNQRDLISIWGSAAALARALKKPEATVKHWFARGSIPAKHDAAIIEAARRAGHSVTPEDLFVLRQEMARRKDRAA
ncbi:carph-isopro domain-containing protein [Oceanicella actignis]|uniref:carph-isopro domain-containing protein n=1 Tax=Oceanicella actignis TaxID=1189325 RepID=UPI003D16010A